MVGRAGFSDRLSAVATDNTALEPALAAPTARPAGESGEAWRWLLLLLRGGGSGKVLRARYWERLTYSKMAERFGRSPEVLRKLGERLVKNIRRQRPR